MIVQITCAPNETLNVDDLGDLRDALESIGFKVDLTHVTRQLDARKYRDQIAKVDEKRSQDWAIEYMKGVPL